MQCEVCKKAVAYGCNVSHSNRHTKTTFAANVHRQTLYHNGKAVSVKICTRCLRSAHKSPDVQKTIAKLSK